MADLLADITFKLNRREFREDGIFSELCDNKGNILAHTLEHSYDSKPKLYDGTFTCVRGTHRLHNNIPFETFEITGVSGHSGILFHIGNWNKDSDGCVLLGSGIAQSSQGQMVTGSIQAFHEFMKLLEEQNSFTLLVQT
jgi:hypothetical protein